MLWFAQKIATICIDFDVSLHAIESIEKRIKIRFNDPIVWLNINLTKRLIRFNDFQYLPPNCTLFHGFKGHVVVTREVTFGDLTLVSMSLELIFNDTPDSQWLLTTVSLKPIQSNEQSFHSKNHKLGIKSLKLFLHFFVKPIIVLLFMTFNDCRYIDSNDGRLPCR